MSRYFAWVDLETTGLYGRSENSMHGEQEHDILEIALIITDEHLDTKHISSFVVQHYDMDMVKSKMNEYVLNMHTNSGLLDKAEKGFIGNWAPLNKIENSMIASIKHYCGDEKPIMAGSSIHFDRFFIAAQMPNLNDHFHYRNFDVSSVKMFYEMFTDEKLKSSNGEPAHEALKDIQKSIDMTKEMFTYFKQKGNPLCFLRNLWN